MSNQSDHDAAMREVKTDLIADLQREQREEIIRQDLKWGDQTTLPNGCGGPLMRVLCDEIREHTQEQAAKGRVTWLNVLQEETAEAFAEMRPEDIYAELLQVEAVSVQWRIALLKQISEGHVPDQDRERMELADATDRLMRELFQQPSPWEEIFRERGHWTPLGTLMGANPSMGHDPLSEVVMQAQTEAWPPHNSFITPGVEPPDDGPPWTIAAYHGRCSNCGEEIEPGDEIRADGQGGWEGRCCEL